MITLAAGPLEAGFAPEAGMVCHSLRHDGEELLTQRDGVEGYVRTGRWMGVPLLHPWANRLAAWDYEALGVRVDLEPLAGDVVVRDRKTGLPIHGVLPREWAVLEAGPARLAAELAGDGAAFPFPHRMRIDAELSPTTLRIATTLEALEGEVPVAFGFHPWFDAPRADRVVELPAMRRLVLDGLLPTGETVAAPVVRGPARGARARRRLRGGRRRRGVLGHGRRAPDRAAPGVRLPLRPGVRPAGQGPGLLRADDRPGRRAADGVLRGRGTRPALPRGVHDPGGQDLSASERIRRCSQTTR